MREISPTEFQQRFFQKNPRAWSVLELFDSLPQIVFYAKDAESRYVRVNFRFLQAHGHEMKESDFLGRCDRDFHPPVMAESYIAEDCRVMEGRTAIRNQTWLVFHEQLPNWYISTKVPLFGEGGEVIGIAGAMYDIEQPEEHERFFRELSPALRHIKSHYAAGVSMAEMAGLSGLSSTHFNRRFQQLLRMTPSAYLRSVRIHAARQRLSNTDRTLAQIAQETGFTDQSHFTRCFRESTGMTPGDYRTRFRRVADPHALVRTDA